MNSAESVRYGAGSARVQARERPYAAIYAVRARHAVSPDLVVRATPTHAAAMPRSPDRAPAPHFSSWSAAR